MLRPSANERQRVTHYLTPFASRGTPRVLGRGFRGNWLAGRCLYACNSSAWGETKGISEKFNLRAIVVYVTSEDTSVSHRVPGTAQAILESDFWESCNRNSTSNPPLSRDAILRSGQQSAFWWQNCSRPRLFTKSNNSNNTSPPRLSTRRFSESAKKRTPSGKELINRGNRLILTRALIALTRCRRWWETTRMRIEARVEVSMEDSPPATTAAADSNSMDSTDDCDGVEAELTSLSWLQSLDITSASGLPTPPCSPSPPPLARQPPKKLSPLVKAELGNQVSRI